MAIHCGDCPPITSCDYQGWKRWQEAFACERQRDRQMGSPHLLPFIGRGFFSAIFFLTSLHPVEARGAGGPLDVRQLLGHQAVDQDLRQDHREHNRWQDSWTDQEDILHWGRFDCGAKRPYCSGKQCGEEMYTMNIVNWKLLKINTNKVLISGPRRMRRSFLWHSSILRHLIILCVVMKGWQNLNQNPNIELPAYDINKLLYQFWGPR